MAHPRRDCSAIYCKGVVPFLKLRDLLADPVPPPAIDEDDSRAWHPHLPRTRTVIPPLGQLVQATIRTGTIVQLQHLPDGLFLVIGTDPEVVYRVVAQPMPRCWWHSRPGRPLRFRHPQPPNRYYIVDSLGKRTTALVQDADGRVCSRYEYRAKGRTLYASTNTPRMEREQRRLDKMFAGLPLPDRRPDIRDFKNSIPKLMTYRPRRMHKRTWMRLILACRYGWRGDQLETETTAELMAYRHRKWNRARWRPEFRANIVPFNLARWQYQFCEERDQEEPGIGDRRYID
jgi:hypothetical protein